jgi:FMN phosphatase YigB (HAD superfamily)
VVRAVFFDVGETLVDETRMWSELADSVGVPRFTFLGVLGGLAARGEHHRRVFELLGIGERSAAGLDFSTDDFYPDALPTLDLLRRDGYLVGAVGNTSEQTEALLAGLVDVVGSSERWGVEKPSPAFFERVVAEAGCEPPEVAYVGDRVDNDVRPAVDAGLVSIHLKRGPWGYLQDGAEAADVRISSLAELPEALPRV